MSTTTPVFALTMARFRRRLYALAVPPDSPASTSHSCCIHTNHQNTMKTPIDFNSQIQAGNKPNNFGILSHSQMPDVSDSPGKQASAYTARHASSTTISIICIKARFMTQELLTGVSQWENDMQILMHLLLSPEENKLTPKNMPTPL